MTPLEWLGVVKGPLWAAIRKAGSTAIDWGRRRRAAARALEGEDLLGEGSLQHLIKQGLDDLATIGARELPVGLQPFAFRNWLREENNVPLFEQAFVAHVGNLPELARQAEERLIAEYERITHDSRPAINDQVRLAIEYAYGQLTASDRGHKLLHLAVGTWTAAQVYKMHRSDASEFPSEQDLARVRSMAESLLESGKRSWKMPQFVAPLTLEAHERREDENPRPTSSTELAASILRGESAVLYGEGGIGKTTFLLELGTACLRDSGRIPLFVDAAAWGRTSQGLLDYLAARPAAQTNRVTPAELTKLAAGGRLVVLLNGWNEVSASSKPVCRDELIQLLVSAKQLNVIVASRTSSDAPTLRDAKKVEVRGLTWHGQAAVVRAELSNERAAPLFELLAKDSRLRHAARSPLILRGLITQAQSGIDLSASVFDLLGAAVRTFEEDEQRRDRLSVAPVDGHQHVYLEELACELTGRLSTRCAREDALRMINAASGRLLEQRLIGSVPSPAAILDILVTYHLLHLDEGTLRFAHHRFQEYFAAKRLLRECIAEGTSTLLSVAINQPAWEDALTLVAAQLRGAAGAGRSRAKLISTAAAIDLGIACDLAAISAFARSEDAALRDSMIARINELASSKLREVRELGVVYQIASGFSEFAAALWPLLESDDHQTRLHSYRIAGLAISLNQLGVDAIQRIAGWTSERRAEFVEEIADNPDNYEFLVRLARDEPDPKVRAAAISSLFWHFPASDVPMQAWLTAPIAVQTDRDVLVHVRYALEDGHIEEAVKERLLSVAPDDASDDAQIQLALASPNDVPACTIEAILRGLRNDSHATDQTVLVDIARDHAPDQLLALARVIALTVRRKPDWAREYLHSAPSEVRRSLFEEAWDRLQSKDFVDMRADFFGPLADREQIDRCIAAHLAYETSASDRRTEVNRDRNRWLEDILAHASGEDLLQSVLNRSASASYGEAVELLSLVMQRIGREDGSNRNRKQWIPSVASARQLVAAFSDKTDTAEVPQETLRVYLSRIVSHVAPAEFGPFILDTCRRYLDAWGIYREKIREWSQHRKQPRPNNPHWGHYLGLAVTQWGPDALPGLLELMDHPNAMDFVPEAMAGVASLPWSSQRERMFSSISVDICDGEERRKRGRVLRQPDDSIQHWTDRAAERLGAKLTEVINTYQRSTTAGDTKLAREAEYRVGGLAAIVARLPSGAVLAPVYQAIASGLMNLHGTVSALRSLVRQGQLISDAAVVAQFEALYERTASARWLDDSTRHSMSEASALLLCAVPEGLGANSLKHYVEQWRRFAHPNEIVRNLGSTRVEAAWPVLLEAANFADSRDHAHEEVLYALVSLLTPRLLPSFLTLIVDGRLFRWCRSAWTLERLAPDIAAVLKAASEHLPAFIEACRNRRSPLADALVVEVLSQIDEKEGTSVSVLLEALDAGRAATPNTPAFKMLRGMFTLHVPLGDSRYEVRAKASNELRSNLYTRAKGTGQSSDASKRLLVSVECGRREHERPLDEPRHPAVEDGLSWTDALRSGQQN